MEKVNNLLEDNNPWRKTFLSLEGMNYVENSLQ